MFTVNDYIRFITDPERVIGKIERALYREKKQDELRKMLSDYDINRDRTSASDNGLYPLFCELASREEKVFTNFRRNSFYNEILEHVTKKQGKQYLNSIDWKFTEDDWNEFLKNDNYGNPRTVEYLIEDKKRKFSPTTIRYVKILGDVLKIFNTEKITSISEIGIGYGGESRIILSYIKNVKKYNLIDLPEVIKLADRYLSSFSMEIYEKANFIDGTSLDYKMESDFVISNYAFSELSRTIQDLYLEKIILCSKAGYILWNDISYRTLDGYSVEELLSLIPGSYVVEENPAIFDGNKLILYSNNEI